jgi:hypothetical protein
LPTPYGLSCPCAELVTSLRVPALAPVSPTRNPAPAGSRYRFGRLEFSTILNRTLDRRCAFHAFSVVHTIDRIRTSIVDVSGDHGLNCIEEVFAIARSSTTARNSSSGNTLLALPVFPGGPLGEGVGEKFMSRNLFGMTRYTGRDSYL